MCGRVHKAVIVQRKTAKERAKGTRALFASKLMRDQGYGADYFLSERAFAVRTHFGRLFCTRKLILHSSKAVPPVFLTAISRSTKSSSKIHTCGMYSFLSEHVGG